MLITLVRLMYATQDRGAGDVNEGGGEVRVLMKSNPTQRESLQAEAEVDPMDGEQTWPTESELQEAEGITRNAGINPLHKLLTLFINPLVGCLGKI